MARPDHRGRELGVYVIREQRVEARSPAGEAFSWLLARKAGNILAHASGIDHEESGSGSRDDSRQERRKGREALVKWSPEG
ncbi:MAG: hypothetical protein ACR2JR_08850 [Rubrobacteraceae bacterium]